MHLKGKNLAPYRVIRQDGMKIHVSPKLIGYANNVQLHARGALRKKIDIDIEHQHGPGCNH